MAEIVTMPRLSDTMTEGVVAKWHKSIGDTISEGDLLAEIETDKATMDFEAFQEGTLLYIGVNEGETAPVDAILAILGEKGENVEELIASHNAGGSSEAAPAAEETPAPTPAAEKAAPAAPAPAAPAPAPTPAHAPAAAAPVAQSGDDRLKVSPLAKKLAEEKGVSLNQVQGTGENGRIVKRDIDFFNPALTQTAAPIVNTSATSDSYTDVTVSQMRKTIARRLGESKFSAPHFYLTMEMEMSEAIKARKALNEMSDVKISFNDIVIKATAQALMKHPKLNASWYGDTIRYYDYVNMGVAVAVDEGLLVPVVRQAQAKSFSQISAEVKDFAQKAKDKKLQPSDWEGNTFTISNLGMFGIEEFTAIINSPDACILAVGGIKQVPVVKNGEVVAGNTMKVTLSCDHRVVDGALGAAFLKTLKGYLENPLSMLL
ncbi:MAG: pyruvate dehydrogenase complex dihydrolipoamide acetyltransferase [Schleiferiaceae bacterium]